MANNYDAMNEIYFGAAVRKAKAYTDEAVENVKEGISFVDSIADLPVVGDPKTIYYVSTPTSAQDGVYDIYVWNKDTQAYVYRGTTQIDLDDYTTDEELNERLAPIEELTDNFTIDDGKLCYVVSEGDSSSTSKITDYEALNQLMLDNTGYGVAETGTLMNDIGTSTGGISLFIGTLYSYAAYNNVPILLRFYAYDSNEDLSTDDIALSVDQNGISVENLSGHDMAIKSYTLSGNDLWSGDGSDYVPGIVLADSDPFVISHVSTNGELFANVYQNKPLALDETLQDLVAAVEQIADNVSTVVESTVSTQVAEQLPATVEDQISPIVEEQVADQIDDVVAAKLPAEVTRQISTPVNQAVNTYCAANFSEWQGGLDSTLTDSSMAAPADKVGNLKSALTPLAQKVYSVTDYVHSTDFTTYVGTARAANNNVIINPTGTPTARTKVLEISQDTELYFNSIPSDVYVSICVLSGFTSYQTVDDITTYYGTSSARYRTMDNNLPTVNNKLSVSNGDYVFITYYTAISEDYWMVYGIDGSHWTYSDDLQDTVDDVSELKMETRGALPVVTKKVYLPTNFKTSADFTMVDGSIYVSGNHATLDPTLTTYNSYYTEIENDTEIYFDSTENYVSICVVKGYYQTYVDENHNYWLGTDASRYRTNDGNLPSVDNKLSVNKGDYIFITIQDSNTVDVNVYGLTYTFDYSERLMNDLNNKKCKVIYDDTVSETETERLYIYIPSKNGYTRINFCHAESAENNYDIWLIHPLYAVNDNLVEQYAITVKGEFECALHEADAPDFMGGTMHGDEIMSDVFFFVDNALVDADDVNTITDFTELRVIVNSALYDASTHEILTAYHAKEYIFNKDGITINQRVKWARNVNITASYLAMFPIAKTVSPKIITNKEYQARVFADDGYFTEDGTTKAISFKDDFNATFEITQWDIVGTGLTNVGRFLTTDNNGGVYNKQYFVCSSSGNVTSGDIWKTTTKYSFEV